ncbi:alpha-glucan phosphorylase [Rubrobacter radiotolerans]|uniref:Alpha-glucan family phosphorylase n=1 Tax=Rubrobacter radiotolerans TaxID=42256 RepID=A0A023WZS5_RUBRA|nr:alpha-glucan family phosphorylase [Rubrobacter radiotolerans]AHY45456.1 alpha-glucan phosphorylase [Rubrobacter radiotolerans]MDX5892867.1 alpha-glucan family phosphorylase [Rubrobacter radiotolerans]SMC02653.1 maltodextrin phosphorylase [Rubrobacter radiotolerans DSM 5868]
MSQLTTTSTTAMQRLPKRLSRLGELAGNLLWSWRPASRELFSRLDPELWQQTEHNPVRLLEETENLEAAAEDAGFVAAYHEAISDLDRYLNRRNTWTDYVYPEARDSGGVAYFSAEFGLHESVPIYSGGLGVLAGDHVKSASDLGFPLVGVGILYAQGYFRQRLDSSGRQSEVYEPFEPESRPLAPALDEFGRPVTVGVNLPGRELRLKVWRVEVGRVSVLLLDADIPENTPEDRELTSRLYGGDNRTRITQEIVLGIGGVRALKRVGLTPAVYHMNEGHAAFLAIERMRELVAVGRSFEQAQEEVRRSTVFTTHTPVPAGHDAFTGDLLWEFMTGWPEALGTDGHSFWLLGAKEGDDRFNMTYLAMNLSRNTNAVSEIHGDVSTEMLGRRITYITNGVHTWSWLSSEMFSLFNENSLGRAWREAPETPSAWSFVEELPPESVWRTHEAAKRKMIDFINDRLDLQAERSGGKRQALDPDALVIGFARRFATYKRATLLLSDPERLKAITRAADRPVQFLFAGKAHPADEPGKAFLRDLYSAPEETGIIVLEDYDMNIARYLVQGVDVWMNNPRRPLEASGTSGQKAALNGIPNFSVLDGWWPEAYNGKNGWAIGEEREFASEAEQDAEDVASLYEILENDLVPLFFSRDNSGVPGGWVDFMKESIMTVAPRFSTQRMVQDYIHKLYSPGLYARR